MHADRTNRVVLTLIGVLTLAVGAATLVAGFGGFGDRFRHRPLTANGMSHYVSRHGNWLWPVIAAGAVIVGILALIWLVKLLFTTDRTGDIAITRTAEDRQYNGGRTTLQSRALTDAVVSEIDSYHGVTGTNARVIGNSDDPTVVVTTAIKQGSNVVDTAKRIDAEALSHLRRALEDDDLIVELNLNLASKPAARTR